MENPANFKIKGSVFMNFRKGTVVSALLLSLFCLGAQVPQALAVDFTERSGNLVLKNGEPIRIARTQAGSVAVQIQYVPSGNRWYLRLQDLKRSPDSQFMAITLVNGTQSLTPQSLPAGNPSPGLDRWYGLTSEDADRLASSKDWKLEAVKENGKTFSEKVTSLGKLIRGLKDPKQKLAPYGPMYILFYPGVAPEKVQDAFLSVLNDGLSFPYVYNLGDSPLACEMIKTESGGTFTGSKGYARFSPQDGGTWMDLDFSQSWYIAGYTTKYGYTPPQSGISTSLDNDFVDHIFQAARTAYQNLEPHNDYGITLKGTFTAKSPTIQQVDSTRHPSLSRIQPGDRLLAINGADVSHRNYLALYMLDYAPAGRPLTLTLSGKDKKSYTVQVDPLVKEAVDPQADYRARRLQEEKGIQPLDKDRIPEMQDIGIFYGEEYDPLTKTKGHITCPTLAPLAQAAGMPQ